MNQSHQLKTNNKYPTKPRTSTSTHKPYVLLRAIPPEQAWKPEVLPEDIITNATYTDVQEHTWMLGDSSHLVVDLETNGVDFSHPDTRIVGIGIAWTYRDITRSVYFDYTSMDDEARYRLFLNISKAQGVVTAYNLLFDGYGIAREATRLGVEEPRWTHCAYALVKMLATEGFDGQAWGLKQMQIDLLSWSETNEEGIDNWLIENGYTRSSKGGPTADKGEMWRCPPAILGSYCILDCLSTLQLFTDVLTPTMEEFPEFTEWYEEYYTDYIRLHWEQIDTGIPVNMDLLRAHERRLQGLMEKAISDVRTGPLAEYINPIEEGLIQEYREREPERYKKKKLGKEPAQFKKDGSPSANYLKWCAKKDAPPTETKTYINWMEKYEEAENNNFADLRMNINSATQLRTLLYDTGYVQYKDSGKSRDKKGKSIPIYIIDGVNGEVELDGTDAGLPPANGDLFSQLPPEVGVPLQLLSDAGQELGYVQTYLECARLHDDGHYRVHPGWRAPGTLTARLAGGGGTGINFQQAPKSVEFLACFYSLPGEKWIEGDWSSLEPHVLAEMSRDPALLALYGPGAKKHDVYLFSGANYAVLGDKIRQHYDVSNPDISSAKKMCKDEREAVKPVFLAKTYGGGAGTIHRSLRLKGFKLSLEQAKDISSSHDELFKVSGREFDAILLKEWKVNRGWILNPIGRPIGVSEKKKKDLINSITQSGGHDVHIMFIVRVARRLKELGIKFKGVIWDFHDQLIFSVLMEFAEQALEVVRTEVAALNKDLGTYVTLKLEPKISTNMAHAKEAENSWCSTYAVA